MKKEFRQNLWAVFSGAAAGGAFLTMLFGFGWPFIIDLPIAAGIYAGLYMITKPKRSIGGLDIDFIENGEELELKLTEAKEDYYNILDSISGIRNPEVKNEARKLAETSAAIIKCLESNPPKIRQARQFIDYYQDSASKLLQKYIDLENSNIETEAICKFKNDTRSALVTLNEAFCGQFEKLMRGELTDKLVQGVSWAEIGLPELYGTLSVDTTDPARSNSGNMFAALLASVLCGGHTADEEGVRAVLPQLKKIFSDLGYMETSSSDLFNQFLLRQERSG